MMSARELIGLLRSIEEHPARIARALSILPVPAINPDQEYRRQVAARLLGIGVHTLPSFRYLS